MRFRTEIAAALAVKMLALAGLYALFFSPSHTPLLTADSVAAHFAGASPGETK
jgi:hypothetical protein